MAKLLDLSVYGPGHISNILQVDASVYAKAFVTDGGKDTQVVRGDGTLASISSLSVGNAATATNAPWSGITGKPTTFTPSAHTHTASDITGLPTSLKNPYKLTFGSKTYDGSAAATITASDLGALTSITKSMVEGVLTGNITSHTHSQYLTSALRPAKLFVRKEMFPPGYFIIKINNNSEWILSFDVKIVVPDGSYTIRFSEDNSTKSEFWDSPSASMIDGEDSIEVKFVYSRTNKLVAIPAPHSLVGISITNVANGYAPIDTYDLDKLFTINFFGGDASDLEYLGTVQETITIYPPSKEGHTHTFASLTSKPTTINGYGITDALTTSNYNSYVPTRTGTGASGTWGISISGNAATATNAPWSGITGKPTTFTPSAHTHTASDITGLPTSLKNPYALTFGSKTYDGSAAATITASDLGALTAHQSIYAFTLQVNGTSKGTYNPASAAKTINIAVPTKTSDITNNSGFITSASIPTALKNPYAVEIKANGVSLGTYDGSVAATFNLSAANVGAANKVHTHTASEISGLPTKLSSFTNDVGYITGITKSMVEGVLTGNITSHTHSYLPLTGGEISGNITWGKGKWGVDVNSRGVFMSWNDAHYLHITGDGAFYDWNFLIHSGNYNSYAPTLTGTGASGTWGISISGNAATATNADKLDGVHYQNILERWHSGVSSSGTATGWFRIAESLVTDSTGITFLLAIQRVYVYANNESYLFSISISYNGGINITQLSGYANSRLITKIRVDWAAGQIAYIDLYINTSTTSNNYNWYTVGCAKSYTEWIANPTLVGTAYEFTTVNGCKSDRGFTGDLVGNATRADVIAKTYANQSINFATGDSKIRLISNTDGNGLANGFPISYVGGISVISNYVGWQMVTYADHTAPNPYFRYLYSNNNWSDWKRLAFLTDNVASATKLQTPRTIWGQSFDGTGNIDGCLSLNYSSTTRATGIEISSTSGGESSIGFALNANTRGVVGCWNNMLNLWMQGFGTILSMPSSGNVLIGTTTDNGYKLQVNGSANATTLYENGTRVALSGHTHDDRYYTESEVDTKLSGKSDTGHTHTKSQITDFPTSMPASDVYAWAKASTKPTYTAAEVGAAAASHTHNYAGSSSAGGAATSVVVTNSNANSTYRMVWHSGNSLYSTDNIYCNPSTDSIYASAFYETSDERLKDFENNVNVDLNLIRFIPKMYFRWKKNPNKLQIGTSAQAVKQIYPELVSSSEDGILSVDYSKLSIVALSAIDKLHLENQNLKHEINLLKQEIEKLKGQI